MVEPTITGAAIIAAGWAGKKLVGPLFDEVAEDWRSRYSQRRIRNLNRIGEKAAAKLGERIDEPGEVPPRVVQLVMDQGSWCDEEVMAEYFGGILASSRSADGRDDRGASWAGLVGGLASFDIYLHYLAYDAVRRLFMGRSDLNLGMGNGRSQATVFLPAGMTLTAMGLESTVDEFQRIVTPAINALVREDLVGQNFVYSTSPAFLAKERKIEVADGGVIFEPSLPGLELFMWASGHANGDINSILRPDADFEADADLGSVPNAQSIEALKNEMAEKKAAEEQASGGP